MPKQVRAFYAYPSSPPDVGETISGAISRLKAEGKLKRNNLRFTRWTDNPVSGKRLVSSILTQIDSHHVFACDLTYLNPNVSFELGYAIGKFKRLFISLNAKIKDAQRNFQRIYFSLLSTGYSEYDNHEDLADAIHQEGPWNSLDQVLLDERYKQQQARPEHPTLMYMRPPLNTDSVIAT